MAVSIRKIQNIPGVRVESLCISLQASKIFPGAVSKHPVRKNALKWLQRTWQTWFISMLRKCSPQEESITWLLSLGRTRRSKYISVLWRNAFSVRDWDVIGHYRKVFGYQGGKFEYNWNHLRKTAWHSFTRFILTGAVVAKQKKSYRRPL